MPVGKRSACMLKKTAAAGILVFRKKGKLSTLYKLRMAVCAVLGNETVDVWLGESSNKAGSTRPRTIPDNSTWDILAVVNKDALLERIGLTTG